MKIPHALAVLLALTSITLAGTVSAAPIGYYADVKTANILGNAHVQGTLVMDDSLVGPVNPLGFDSLSLSGGFGGGLGSGHVTESNPLVFSLAFEPSVAVQSIETAWLSIALADDFWDLHCTGLFNCSVADEYAIITVNGDDFWADDPGTNWILGEFAHGDITGQILQSGDSIQVSVTSSEGDFDVRGAALAVAFNMADGSTSSPIPEPSAAMLFAIGALLVTRRRLH